VGAILLRRSHVGPRTVLTYRAGRHTYQVQFRGAGRHEYAVIKAVGENAHAAFSGPAYASVALAVGQELSRLAHTAVKAVVRSPVGQAARAVILGLARTGGGAVGRFFGSRVVPLSILLLGLVFIGLGVATRRVSYATR
jgi:hypothetical protein